MPARQSINISTPAARRRLPPRREPYWHPIRTGLNLGFRRTARGGTWIVRLAVEGKFRHQSLGDVANLEDFEDAIAAATTWARGLDDDEQHLPDYRVAECVADYVRHLHHHNSPDAATRTEQRAAKWIAPTLGKLRVARLTTRQIERWHASMVPTGLDADATRAKRDTANRVLTILKAALNRAFQQGRVASDAPWRRVKPFKRTSARRKVFLSPEQADALVAACEPSFALLVRAGLLTGARYGELVAARVGDLDLDAGVWHLPRGKTGARDVVLAPKVAAFFRQLAEGKAPTDHLLLRADGQPWKRSQQQRPMAEAVARAGLDPACVFYSLRHTYVSRALLAGLPPQVVAEHIGSSIVMLEKHYGHFLRQDRAALLAQVDL